MARTKYNSRIAELFDKSVDAEQLCDGNNIAGATTPVKDAHVGACL